MKDHSIHIRHPKPARERWPFSGFVRLATAVVLSAICAGCGGDDPQTPSINGGGGVAADTTPPGAITSLIAKSATSSTIALQWFVPGDDGNEGRAQRYDIRHCDTVLTDQTWERGVKLDDVPEPKLAPAVEILVVRGLAPGQLYYFAVKSYDEVGNESALSNCTHGTTLGEIEPPEPPSDVVDLAADATADTEFLLTWTAPGDDGGEGPAAEYDVRYSVSPITSSVRFANAQRIDGVPAPRAVGEPESLLVDGLYPGMNYFFVLKSADEDANWSKMSNHSPGLALGNFLLADPTLIPPDQYREDINVVFRTTSSSQVAEVTVLNLQWVSAHRDWELVEVRHLVEGSFEPGTHWVTWDWKGDDGGYVAWPGNSVTIKFHLDGELVGNIGLRLD